MGFIYEADNELLIPKPLELPSNARQQILDVFALKEASTTNYARVKVIIEKELRERLVSKLKTNISRHQWEALLKGNLG